ncbi:hypothetical protein [Paenibacillus polymyxa]|uniref:hypothetical protein n=1 Tax=Paenibacillus polymyxa TaxID=1406 RepID=UPI00287F5998|nr:hypothetical protein [Paenibacillus polymyxa]
MYAYLDKYQILHVVNEKELAEKYALNKKIVEVDIEEEHGYPVINKQAVVYYAEDGAAFIYGNRTDKRAKQIITPEEITKIVNKLK